MAYILAGLVSTISYGNRAFSVTAPYPWNPIPLSICSADTVKSFKCQLALVLLTPILTMNATIVGGGKIQGQNLKTSIWEMINTINTSILTPKVMLYLSNNPPPLEIQN